MLDEGAAANEAYLHRIIKDPHTHQTRVASAKRNLAFTPAGITRPPTERAKQEPAQTGRGNGPRTVKGLTGSEKGVDKAKRPKLSPAPPQICTKSRTVCHYYSTTTTDPCCCQQCKEDNREERRYIIEGFKCADVPNRGTLPRLDDAYTTVRGAQVFSAIDLTAGYHQVRLPEEDVPKTSFRTPLELFQFKVLPFRLRNAPQTFQAMMNEILSPLNEFCLHGRHLGVL